MIRKKDNLSSLSIFIKLSFVSVSLLLVLAIFNKGVAAKPGLQTKQKGEIKSKNSGENEKSGDNGKLKEINRIWMDEIHNKSKNLPEEEKKGNVQFKNPGVSEDSSRKLDSEKQSSAPAPSIFSDSDNSSFTSLVLRFVGILAIMLGAFYLLVRFIKSKSAVITGGNELIKIITSVSLIQGKFIQIIDLAGKIMIVSVSESGIQLLHTIDDARTADRIRLWQSNHSSTPAGTEGILAHLTRFFKNNDYRFWSRSQGTSAPGGRLKKDFRTFIKNEGGTIPFFTDETKQKRKFSDNRSFAGDSEIINNAAETETKDEIQTELKKLLKVQKHRLSTLKGKNRS